MKNNVQLAAWGYSGAFAVAFAIAFIPNPLVGSDSLFKTNIGHDLVHLLTAIGFAWVAKTSARASVVFMKSFGFVYLGVAILGFILLGGNSEGHMLGIIHINTADNFLHLGLAIAILSTGFMFNKTLKST